MCAPGILAVRGGGTPITLLVHTDIPYLSLRWSFLPLQTPSDAIALIPSAPLVFFSCYMGTSLL
jgi:hypothetical protein